LIKAVNLAIIGLMEQHLTKSPAETKQLAHELSRRLKGGEVIGLVGDLGAGKTVFMQGLAEAFKIKEPVKSPTFVLFRKLEIPRPIFGFFKKQKIKQLIHVDAYRLKSIGEFKEIGLEEYFGQKDTIVVIEWADRAEEILPDEAIMIYFKQGNKEDWRVIRIDNHGETPRDTD
jgi:tRNA threonylcarbamoyladenosine biosynthesis protein TsaE